MKSRTRQIDKETSVRYNPRDRNIILRNGRYSGELSKKARNFLSEEDAERLFYSIRGPESMELARAILSGVTNEDDAKERVRRYFGQFG